MKVWKDPKTGKWLDRKEFMTRWRDGITKVTPYQQIKVTLLSFTPLLVGMLWGIIVAFITETWWLMTCLIGALLISSLQFFGHLQKYFMLQKIERGEI